MSQNNTCNSYLYIITGFPSDSYYGNTICYHGTNQSEACNSEKWSGDFSEGFRLTIYKNAARVYNDVLDVWTTKILDLDYNSSFVGDTKEQLKKVDVLIKAAIDSIKEPELNIAE